jgi:NAD(P)-dependent dehydrogenase (short-subunit alcohol dehydrogenase family)
MSKTTTLITGANKGLGREAARRLLAEGHEVWVAARDTSLGQAAADELGARFVQFDVTDEDSVTAAAALVAAATGGRTGCADQQCWHFGWPEARRRGHR